MVKYIMGMAVAFQCLFGCACVPESTSVDDQIDEARLRRRLGRVKPTVAAYMGVGEKKIKEWRSGPISPRTAEEAQRAGLDGRRVIDFLKPTNLRGGMYTWVGRVEFELREDARRRLFRARCFYDASAGSWKLDQVYERSEAESAPGEPKQFWWLSVEPAREGHS